MKDWISVKERLPENDCRVDVWMPEYDSLYKRHTDVNFTPGDKTFWIDYDLMDITKDVSHWMPLPEPPNQEK